MDQFTDAFTVQAGEFMSTNCVVKEISLFTLV